MKDINDSTPTKRLTAVEMLGESEMFGSKKSKKPLNIDFQS